MRKFMFFFLCLCIVWHNSLSQTPANKDSLLRVLQTAPDDTAKIRLLLAVQKLYSTSNFDSSFYFLNQASALAQQLNTSQFDYTINNKYSIYYYFNNDYDKAIAFALKSLDAAEKEKDPKLQARIYNNIAGIYNHFGRPKRAVDYTLQCLALAEKEKDSLNFSNYNITASETYANARQFDKAVYYAQKGIEYGYRFQDMASVMNGLNNLSVCYAQLNKPDSAVVMNLQQLALAKRLQSVVYINYALINLCYNNFKTGHTAAVHQYATELKNYTGLLPDRQLSAEAHVAFALDGMGQKQFDAAAAELNSGIQIAAADSNILSLENLYNIYSTLCYMQGKLKEAAVYDYKRDSLVQVRNLEELNFYTRDLEKKYETESKEAEIRLQQTALKQKTWLTYFLTAGAALLLLILILGYRNYRNRQHLQQAKIDELEAEKQLTAAGAVLKGEEQERTRLARDLHDGLGGMLSGIKYSFTTMKENLILTPENAQAFERSMDMLDSSIREMRRVAHSMMPEMLLKYGLNTALKEFCNEIDRSGVIQIRYQSIGVDGAPLSQTVAVALYRIVQELVNNTIRHAGASNLLVQLHVSGPENRVTLTVEDNGKGMDPSVLKQASGIGWSNIRNRVEFLQGTVDIHSEPGKGTSVFIEIDPGRSAI